MSNQMDDTISSDLLSLIVIWLYVLKYIIFGAGVKNKQKKFQHLTQYMDFFDT